MAAGAKVEVAVDGSCPPQAAIARIIAPKIVAIVLSLIPITSNTSNNRGNRNYIIALLEGFPSKC